MKKQVWLWALYFCLSVSQAAEKTKIEIRYEDGRAIVSSTIDSAGEDFLEIVGGTISKSVVDHVCDKEPTPELLSKKSRDHRSAFESLHTCYGLYDYSTKIVLLKYKNKRYLLTRDVDGSVLGGYSEVPYKDISGQLTMWVKQKKVSEIYAEDEWVPVFVLTRVLEITIQEEGERKKSFLGASYFFLG
jgi:hypothetical protein